MRLSRRQLLSGLLVSSCDWLDSVLEAVGDEREGAPAETWIPVGTLSHFTPGTQRPVNRGHHIVLTDMRGLIAVDSDERRIRRPLRVGERGQILLNPRGKWPDHVYLSAMTGMISEEREV